MAGRKARLATPSPAAGKLVTPGEARRPVLAWSALRGRPWCALRRSLPLPGIGRQDGISEEGGLLVVAARATLAAAGANILAHW